MYVSVKISPYDTLHTFALYTVAAVFFLFVHLSVIVIDCVQAAKQIEIDALLCYGMV